MVVVRALKSFICIFDDIVVGAFIYLHLHKTQEIKNNKNTGVNKTGIDKIEGL